jgi:hypothetical protein
MKKNNNLNYKEAALAVSEFFPYKSKTHYGELHKNCYVVYSYFNNWISLLYSFHSNEWYKCTEKVSVTTSCQTSRLSKNITTVKLLGGLSQTEIQNIFKKLTE